MRALLATAVLWPSLAIAQTRPDLEYRDTEVDEQKDERLTVRGFFESQYYEYDNLDFRTRDESSDQAIRDSDDRGAFAFSGAQLEVGYEIDPQVRFVVTGSHRGLWGDDQIGETNAFGGFIYFPALYADLYTTPDPTRAVRFRVGRQFFTLGGLGPGVRDYVLADVLDMIRIDIPLSDALSITVLPINVYSTSSNYDSVDFVSLIGQQNPETFEFRGDVLTRRVGLTVNLDNDATDTVIGGQAHLFYSDLHGRGTGGDISFQGALGNFTDNDYLVNWGLRLNARLGPVRPFAELDGSLGVDRKELTLQDVNTNGLAWGGGARLDTRSADTGAGVLAQLRYFEAQGSVHTNNGLRYSHGFVGLKGQQIGGTLLNRFMGWHPTAYVGRDGVDDNPQDMTRKAGTRSLELWGSAQLASGFHALGGLWFVQDTGYSDVNFNRLDRLEIPFGTSRSEFAATERLGKVLATELDAEIGWQFGKYVDTFVRGAIVIPGAFYGIEIDRQAGDALGSADPAMPWAAHGGLRVSF